MNNEPKLKVDEQLCDINYLKEQCDIDDEDEIQQIKDPRNPMKRTSLCV